MKHYYIAHKTAPMLDCEYHYVDAGDYRVIALINERATSPTEWEPLPHLLDAATPVSDAHAKLLATLGITKTTGFAVAQELGKLHPLMKP